QSAVDVDRVAGAVRPHARMIHVVGERRGRQSHANCNGRDRTFQETQIIASHSAVSPVFWMVRRKVPRELTSVAYPESKRVGCTTLAESRQRVSSRPSGRWADRNARLALPWP